ncbi:MAG: dUTP diphosphatase [bacterium]|nr:dUTP diphosphatase [bacterium]
MKRQNALIRLIDKTLPLPEYQTEGSVAFDLYARKSIYINPGTMELVPLNVCIKIPKGHVAIMAPRSSLFKKKKLVLANNIGIIDEDFCGNDDEYLAQLYNVGPTTTEITRGERICQILIIPITKMNFEVVDTMPDKSRGGFGSTG